MVRAGRMSTDRGKKDNAGEAETLLRLKEMARGEKIYTHVQQEKEKTIKKYI